MNKLIELFKRKTFLIVLFIACSSFAVLLQSEKPVLYIIGDSTVKNGDGTGKQSLWGWGSFLGSYFDEQKIEVQNHAIGGRSSRTFLTEGRWDKILATLKPGDYVMMQFGHNDAGPLDDTARARGTIKGTGDDSVEIYNPIRKMKEVVHSYGWYMRKYVLEAKAKGATPIICSLIPRNNWKDGKVIRSNEGYGLWAREIAEKYGAYFIDLNNSIADVYERMDPSAVKKFFPVDNTHTNKEGALLNVGKVIKGIRSLNDCRLKDYLLNK